MNSANHYKCCIRCRSPAILICQRCRETYCSPECQNMHWPVHKLQCSITNDNLSSFSFRSRHMTSSRKTDRRQTNTPSELNFSVRARNDSYKKEIHTSIKTPTEFSVCSRNDSNQKEIARANPVKYSAQHRLANLSIGSGTPPAPVQSGSQVEPESPAVEPTPVRIPIAYQSNRIQSMQLLLKAHLASKNAMPSE